MTNEQQTMLHKIINSILNLGASIGIVISNVDKQAVISYYEEKVNAENYEQVVTTLLKLKYVINRSNLGYVLSSMVNTARKHNIKKAESQKCLIRK